MPVLRVQVQRQLRRILEDEIFVGTADGKGAPTVAALLQHIVAMKLEGNAPTENDLLTGFFKRSLKKWDEDDPIARQNVRNLRKRLADYYAKGGLNDLVLIEIPLGQYGAVFTYNPRSPAQKEVKL